MITFNNNVITLERAHAQIDRLEESGWSLHSLNDEEDNSVIAEMSRNKEHSVFKFSELFFTQNGKIKNYGDKI